ncbi:MAG: hypothetical protein PHF31_05770 [Methylobacter sp.]|nr:hypothetical protein [Methylobacter sp.]
MAHRKSKLNEAPKNVKTAEENAAEVRVIHDLTEEVLLSWLEAPPTERRHIQALDLLAEAIQLLRSACINLGEITEVDGGVDFSAYNSKSS